MISYLITIIAIVLVVAFIALIGKKVMDGERIDMQEGIVGIVLIMVAVLIIGAMSYSVADLEDWDEDTGTLTIKMNIASGSQRWDDYAADVKNLIIEDGVTSIGDGAFENLTSLRYISIPASIETMGTGAFSVSLADPYGHARASDLPGEYAGAGDGTLYLCDPTIFTYNAQGYQITGLSSSGANALYLVFPGEVDGHAITELKADSFQDNSRIKLVTHVPDCQMTIFYGNSFHNCTALETVIVPPSVKTFGYQTFRGCTSLETLELPAALETIGQSALAECGFEELTLPAGLKSIAQGGIQSCSSLKSIAIPNSVTSLGDNVFQNCSALETATLGRGITALPNYTFSGCTSLKSIAIPAGYTSIGEGAFRTCTEIESVSFPASLTTVGSASFSAWTFYQSDGTTQIDKTVASALAGKRFQGTASALVEISQGRLTLTPEQIQQVHLHDVELQDLKDQISIDPLPLQPSLQEQELTA